jgi:hypothetical protein
MSSNGTSNGSPSLIKQVASLVKASFRPLPPRFGDGRYDADVDPKVIKAGIIKELESQGKRIPADLQLLVDYIIMQKDGGYLNDRLYTVRPHFLSFCISG